VPSSAFHGGFGFCGTAASKVGFLRASLPHPHPGGAFLTSHYVMGVWVYARGGRGYGTASVSTVLFSIPWRRTYILGLALVPQAQFSCRLYPCTARLGGGSHFLLSGASALMNPVPGGRP